MIEKDIEAASRPVEIDPRDWMKQDPPPYLPEFLQDFHDAKDFFKTLQVSYKFPADLEGHNWVSNHIFTVDFFLWFCGIHGYTLQKSRKKGVKFEDLWRKIDEMKNVYKPHLDSVLGSIDHAPLTEGRPQGVPTPLSSPGELPPVTSKSPTNPQGEAR